MSHNKILGIVGGMGSVAGAAVFNRLVELTPALTDQAYIEVFVHNNPRIPDRTEYLLAGGPSPLPELRRSVSLLNGLGADFIVPACVTASYFINDLRKGSVAEFIHPVKETIRYCQERYPHLQKFGVLASTGALRLGIFQEELSRVNLRAVVFEEPDQRYYVMEPIYAHWGIKAGNVTGEPRRRLVAAVRRLERMGAEAMIAGCSELPLVLRQEELPLPVIDSMDCLCRAAIQRCLTSQLEPDQD